MSGHSPRADASCLIGAAVVSSILCWSGSSSASSPTESNTRKTQEMLIWLDDYDGMVDGVIGPATKQAIGIFQKSIDHSASGELTPAEFSILRKMGEAKKTAVGFQQVDDHVTGVSVAMPLKLVSGPIRKTWGQNWAAPDDSINIDTFRYAEVTLKQVCERLRDFKNRQVTYYRLAEDWCVVGGIDGDGAGIYVRAAVEDSKELGSIPEIRGFSVRLAGKDHEQLWNIPVAMSSTFALIQVGQTPVANHPRDLLTTSVGDLKKMDNTSGALSSIKCFNGLGNCAPDASACLKGSGPCPASLPGHNNP